MWRLDPVSTLAFTDFLTLAEARCNLSDLDAAFEAAQSSLIQNPNYVWTYLLLARIHACRGELGAARKNLDEAARITPSLIHLMETDPLGRYDRTLFEEADWSPPTVAPCFRVVTDSSYS